MRTSGCDSIQLSIIRTHKDPLYEGISSERSKKLKRERGILDERESYEHWRPGLGETLIFIRAWQEPI